MPIIFRNRLFSNPLQLVFSFLLGSVFAWLLIRDLANWVSAGNSVSDKYLPLQILIFALFNGFFSAIILGLLRLNESLNEHSRLKPRTFLAILGGLTGALIFYLIYGTGTLDISRVDWLFNLGDNAQHYLGWVFYRNDPWTFPIGFSQSMAYPGGSCMCFTDSIPLLAIPFKLLRDLLPATFQYFGWWTLFSFIMQGGLAALILYEVTKNRTAALIAPLFFCIADILLFRVFRYTPLSGQWIVLLALYLYFLNQRENRWNWLWPVVHCMAVLIQGYFFVMAFVIFCGAMLERYLKDRKLLPIGKNLVLSLTSTTLIMWLVGFFTDSVDMSDAGLGYFKANLNAFINPVEGWSKFFQPLPLAPGTYPNVNYLGIGIILLLIVGMINLFLRKAAPFSALFRNQVGLILIIPVLVVFSLSNIVTWNEFVLFTYTLPEPLMRLWGVFRGTERMLWPVYYLIFIFAISQATKWSSRNWVTAVILLAGFGIQYVEVAPLLQHFHSMYSEPVGKKTSLRSDFWDDAAAQYKSVAILPLNLDNWARLSEFAADNRMNINYAYFARQSPALERTAGQKVEGLLQGETAPDEMYVIKSPDLLRAVCSRFGGEDFLGYVNKEWVLAPAFEMKAADYADISITGINSNCSQLGLADFLIKYREKLLVLTVMHDVSAMMDNQIKGIFNSFELQKYLQNESGMSYIAVVWGNQVMYENLSPKKITFAASRGENLNGIKFPVNLQISSAGRISGEEDAGILINNRDYSYHKNGLNIAVIDPESGRVLDTGIFEPQN
ncbi:MAG: DUF6311 domain-containing protein [Leptolinea sp.]